MSKDDMWAEPTPIKRLLPEINKNQYPLLQKAIQEILGIPIDTNALVQQGDRNGAKNGFAKNELLTQQQLRLNKLFGIEEKKREHTAWWTK